MGFFGFTAIHGMVDKHNERVQELLRILNWLAALIGREENAFTAYGIEGTHFAYKDGLPVKNDRGRVEIGAVLGDAQGIVLAILTNLPQIALNDEAGDAEDAPQVQADALASVIAGREQLGYRDAFL